MGLAGETFSLLRRRDFATLMGAQWFSQAADGLVVGALAKFITFGGQEGFDVEAAKSPEEAFRIVLFTFLPMLVLSPFLGVFIDRWDRRKLLIGANGVRAVALAAAVVLGGAEFRNLGSVPLYAVLLLTIASTRLLLALKGAALPATLGERDLIQGNSVSQAGSALFQLVGGGAALVASGFLAAPFVVAAGVVVYGIAVAFSFATRTLGYARPTVPLAQELGRVLRDIAEGLREVSRRPRAGLALTSFLAVRSLATLTVLAVGFASLAFVADAGIVGKAIPGVAGAAGAVAGLVVAVALKERTPPGTIVSLALFLGGIGVAAFGGVISLLGIAVSAFSVGLSFFLGKIGVDTLMQQGLADAFRGRGFSFQDAVYNLSW
ncbi:MAG TPA: MFS transporter, partial [Actinomycetota bacterium]|nr:MFS transporter [Actinomycetota bacterium]